MVKPKFIHEQFGISTQTLHNWKNSEGDKFLLYQYLISRSEDEIIEAMDPVRKLHKYQLLTIKEFAELVKENWFAIKDFHDYIPIDLVIVNEDDPKDKEKLLLAATHRDNPRKSMVIRFDVTLGNEENINQDVEKIKEVFIGEGMEMPDVYYVSYTGKTPSLPNNIGKNVNAMHYSELAKKFTKEKIIIV